MLLLKISWIGAPLWTGRAPTAVEKLEQISLQFENVSASMSASASRSTSTSTGSIPAVTDTVKTGQFWMYFDSFLKGYESVQVNWNPSIWEYQTKLHFSADLLPMLVVGEEGVNLCSSQCNFTILVRCQGESPLWLLLCRHFKDAEDQDREHSGEKFEACELIGLATYDGCDKMACCDPRNARTSSSLLASNEVLHKLQSSEWDRNSTAVVPLRRRSSGSPDTERYTLYAFAKKPVSLVEAEGWKCRISFDSAWNYNSSLSSSRMPTHAGWYGSLPGSTGHEDVVLRLLRLEVEDRSSLVLMLECSRADLELQVALAYDRGTTGTKMMPPSQRDVIVTSGQPRCSCAVAKVYDLEKGVYWLLCLAADDRGRVVRFGVGAASDARCVITDPDRMVMSQTNGMNGG